MSSALRAWGRLLRVSLFPTAVADVVAGLLLGRDGDLPTPGTTALLVGASLGVYHGGLVLNDCFDRAHDAATRPDRPLPSGAVPPRAALVAGFGLLALGVGLALQASPATGAWMAGVALLALLYDARGRGPWLGPLLLGLCRAGNLALGLVHAGVLASPALAAPVAYGLYVFVVSRLGRLEDGEDGALGTGRPRRLLLAAAALLMSVAGLPIASATLESRLLALTLTALGAAALVRRALSSEPWSRARVGASMGLALRRLLIFTTACAALTGTWTGVFSALALLAGFPISWSLRKHFPPS